MTKQLLKPIAATAVLAIIGAFSVWAQEPWLMPSLGSAVFVQTLTPEEPTATPYVTGVGQLLGLVSGFIGVYIAAATVTPMFMGENALTFARVLAVAVATLLTAGLQLALKAKSPAGGATAVVVALGLETANWAGAWRLVVGIALVTALGEAARQIILRAR